MNVWAVRSGGHCISSLVLSDSSFAMAGRLLQRLRTKDPALLVQQCHQAFTRLPFEANHERIAEELSKFLAALKVRVQLGARARLAPLPLPGSRA